ncbi:MAG: hypothetical protein J0I19_06240 [Alphaproteobacteria bacterium]|nr:hypothetical protein [Alphaproteobacteria bacterium]
MRGARFALGVAILTGLFLAIALWNGFPLVFYDTGGYLAEGLEGVFLAERSPVYSLLLLVTGAAYSLWPVVILQAGLTAWLIAETARIEVPGLSLKGLVGIGLVLMLMTGIGWYTGQVEPDCMTALVVLGAYLLLFRTAVLGRRRMFFIAIVTGLAVACHPSHLGLMSGLLVVGIGLRFVRPSLVRKILPAGGALLFALSLIFTSNYVLTRQVFLTRSGSVFVFARLMQDGIVKRLLDETCPQSGYRLCAFRHRLKTRADAWLWAPDSLFRTRGGFRGDHTEENRIIADSIRRYPFLQVRAAVRASARQFFAFKTGDGIESQEWVLKPDFEKMAPEQLPEYLAARQQQGRLRFAALNMIHVTVGMFSLLGLLLLLQRALIRRDWSEAALPGLVLTALIGNAIICGTFSNPHDRYQSRVIWLPGLVLILARMRNPGVLRPHEESGT